MKIFLKSSALSASLMGLMIVSSPLAQAGETVELNKTQILRLPQPAAAIIVGNPNIADISVQSDKTLFLIGRGYGETNVLILDAYDNVMMDSVITVIAPKNDKQVNLILGAKDSQSYHCAPFCQPSPRLGNSASFISSNSSQDGGTPNGEALLSSSPAPAGGNITGAPTALNNPGNETGQPR